MTKARVWGPHILLSFQIDLKPEERHMSEIRKQLGTLSIFLNAWIISASHLASANLECKYSWMWWHIPSNASFQKKKSKMKEFMLIKKF